MKKFLITIELPDGINYFCGFKKVKSGHTFIEWDTDINYAKKFNSKYEAKQDIARIETDETLSIQELTLNH